MQTSYKAKPWGIDVTMHFAQVAFALIAGGAAVLIVAGLVLEVTHDRKRPTPTGNVHPLPPGLVDTHAPASQSREEAVGSEASVPSESGKRRGKKGASGGENRAANRRRRKERRMPDSRC